MKSLQRKELWKYLFPLVKSFGVWLIAVSVVAIDYTYNRWFSMGFVHFTTYTTYILSKLLSVQISLLGSSSDIVTTLNVNYDMLHICNYPFKIELECSAYHAYIAVVALIIFSAWKQKDKFLYGIIFIVTLAILNSLRIIALGIISQKFPSILNLMHDYIWNILLVIILWGLWELINNKLTKTP